MKHVYFIMFVSVLSFNLYSQDTMHVNTPPMGLVAPATKDSGLSAQPTAQELANLFVSASGGEMNPMDAVNQVVRSGENAIPGLTDLLFNKTIKSSKHRRDKDQEQIASQNSVTPDDKSMESVSLVPNKIFAVLALDAIGTPNALAALLKAADKHENPEIRGVALNALGNTFYTNTSKVPKGNISPDKSIIRILINSTDDTTYIGYLQKRTDGIAQEGLIRWLGKDFGDPQFNDARNKGGKKTSVKDYQKGWLKDNEKKLTWNKETRHFEVPGY